VLLCAQRRDGVAALDVDRASLHTPVSGAATELPTVERNVSDCQAMADAFGVVFADFGGTPDCVVAGADTEINAPLHEIA
jgi:hypothetical protein